MKTEIEPRPETLNADEIKASGGGMPVVLWLVALVFVISSFVVYQKVSGRRVDPPPPPVNVKSILQVNQTLYAFVDRLVKDDWDGAQKMLSVDAQKKLTDANQSLRDSLLAQRKGKDQKVINGGPTQEDALIGENSVRHNVVFYFDKNETITLPITVVKETVNNVDRLAIADWGAEANAPASPAASAK